MDGKGIIIIVPAFEPRRGGGHLTRCMKLAAELRSRGKQAVLFVSSQSDPSLFFQSLNLNPQWRITEIDLQQIVPDSVEFIIIDRFQTPKDELLNWKKIAPVIGIDEGGGHRDKFDFLIDILAPKNFHKPSANITSSSLLYFPKRPLPVKLSAEKKIKILVSFGHEDPTGLGDTVAHNLSFQNKNGNLDIALLKGVLHTSNSSLKNVRVIDAIPNLAEHLGEYDIIITHYGITAYEALYAKTAILLVNPTTYHEKLAKAAGFFTAKNLPKINQSFLRKLKNHCAKQAVGLEFDKENKNLADLIDELSPKVNRSCPVCGGESSETSLARFSEGTYRRCKKCGVIYIDRIKSLPLNYDQEYFFENYKNQYGKTYLEDFPNLTAMANRRLKKIKSLMPVTQNDSLLDIGCAYGPFLAAAKEKGFSPCGIEPAKEAARYVQKKLRLTVVHGSFPDTWFPVPTSQSAQYEVVTLWYVIEHFEDCLKALSEIRKVLEIDGILAFSTPSFSGISGRSSLYKFLKKNPADHFTIWSPKMCKKALSLTGFKVKKIVISGHHPERFRFFGILAGSKISPIYWILFLISKIFRLGDTFEVYAVKKALAA
jgi:spore coat polysaccharide biosynthesis predicted glycosyltransferase SpsG/2-polyprenyl-3-methyl-5-hydroxy-6-metoxy-1,4-benzoquinol methylase